VFVGGGVEGVGDVWECGLRCNPKPELTATNRDPNASRLAKTPQEIGMATGATIHTANGMMVSVVRRQAAAAGTQQQQRQPLAAV